jgi:hypothetical protein
LGFVASCLLGRGPIAKPDIHAFAVLAGRWRVDGRDLGRRRLGRDERGAFAPGLDVSRGRA